MSGGYVYRCGLHSSEYVHHNSYCTPKSCFDTELRETCLRIEAGAQKHNDLLLAEAKKQRRSARRQNKRLRQDIAALTAAVNRLAAPGEAKTGD